MMTDKFKIKEGMLNVIQLYAPTSAYSEADSDAFHDALQLHIQNLPKESLIVMGDFNAKVGADNSDWVPTLGNFGLGKANNRGEKLL